MNGIAHVMRVPTHTQNNNDLESALYYGVSKKQLDIMQIVVSDFPKPVSEQHTWSIPYQTSKQTNVFLMNEIARAMCSVFCSNQNLIPILLWNLHSRKRQDTHECT